MESTEVVTDLIRMASSSTTAGQHGRDKQNKQNKAA
ncbi:uncharacterized protein METZ01_LOCUS403853 [marine metagenome]|uniref:Uncharacterized protein n=1 Tax=marine metagenome TaxID=408172 RepID=A0A382VWX7_9ZZZZ